MTQNHTPHVFTGVFTGKLAFLNEVRPASRPTLFWQRASSGSRVFPKICVRSQPDRAPGLYFCTGTQRWIAWTLTSFCHRCRPMMAPSFHTRHRFTRAAPRSPQLSNGCQAPWSLMSTIVWQTPLPFTLIVTPAFSNNAPTLTPVLTNGITRLIMFWIDDKQLDISDSTPCLCRSVEWLLNAPKRFVWRLPLEHYRPRRPTCRNSSRYVRPVLSHLVPVWTRCRKSKRFLITSMINMMVAAWMWCTARKLSKTYVAVFRE